MNSEAALFSPASPASHFPLEGKAGVVVKVRRPNLTVVRGVKIGTENTLPHSRDTAT